jgi:hypothetical protein
MLYLDYAAPIDAIRAEAQRIAEASPDWDKKVVGVQVTDTKQDTIEVRILVSSPTAGQAWNLRCEVREKIIAFLQREHPEALPRRRFARVAEQGPLFADLGARPQQPIPRDPTADK